MTKTIKDIDLVELYNRGCHYLLVDRLSKGIIDIFKSSDRAYKALRKAENADIIKLIAYVDIKLIRREDLL